MDSWKKIIQKIGSFWPFQTMTTPDPRIFRGYFDGVWCEHRDVVVSGWVISAQGPYDSLILYVNGKPQSPGEAIFRSDVGKGLPEIPNSSQCGFRFRARVNDEEMCGRLDIRIACIRGNREVDTLNTVFYCDLYTSMPTPPAKLISRVDGSSSEEFYLLKGAQNYGEFLKLIEKHRDISTITSLLDWGCGSGRLSGFFLKYTDIPQIQGCDIDAEAIAWAQKNFPRGIFSAIPFHPPTQYKANQFDLIISFSVLTHLDRENQNDWLDEMQRIAKPGGLFIATVHGIKAAQVILSKSDVEVLRREGIHDSRRDNVLEGVAPKDYYRASFQTQEYIRRHWNRYFDLIDVIEQGASNYHDIVIMRKRD